VHNELANVYINQPTNQSTTFLTTLSHLLYGMEINLYDQPVVTSCARTALKHVLERI